MQISFHESSNHVLDRDNKTKLVPASFCYERKVNYSLKSVIVINNRFNLFISGFKLENLQP